MLAFSIGMQHLHSTLASDNINDIQHWHSTLAFNIDMAFNIDARIRAGGQLVRFMIPQRYSEHLPGRREEENCGKIIVFSTILEAAAGKEYARS